MDDDDHKGKIVKMAAGLLVPVVIGTFSFTLGSSKFAQAWQHFEWVYALRAFFGFGAFVWLIAAFFTGVRDGSKTLVWTYVGFLTVFLTIFAGLMGSLKPSGIT